MINSINQVTYRPAWLVKPTHACNFRCKYCYETDYRHKYGDDVMSMEIWERIVSIASKYNAQIIFHGGEPLMAGIDWYREAFAIADKYPPLSYGMQSNGSLLDEEYIKLFIERNLNYGFSYDFFEQEECRGKDIIENIKLAKEHGMPVGCICVITKKNINKMIEVFEYASQISISFLAFNPLFFSGCAIDNNVDMLTVSDIKNGFREYFEYYKHRKNKSFVEREAETYISIVRGIGARQCAFTDCRIGWVGVCNNGDVLPCDRYYGDEYKYGNIMDFKDVMEFAETAGFSKYFRDCKFRYDNYCSKCSLFCVCNGGCNGRHKDISFHKVQEAALKEFGSKSEYTELLRRADIFEQSAIDELTGIIEDIVIKTSECDEQAARIIAKKIYENNYGLGAITELYYDLSISEIWVNDYDDIWIERNGLRTKCTNLSFQNQADVRRVIDLMNRFDKKEISAASPIVEAKLADGSRLTSIVPPVSEHPIFNLRCPNSFVPTTENLLNNGTLDKGLVELLTVLVKGRANILVIGETGAGKTQLIRWLIGHIRRDLHVVTMETRQELFLKKLYDDLSAASLEECPEYNVGHSDLFRVSLRMTPSMYDC